MTLPQLIWWLKSLKSCFFIIRSSKRLMNSVKICCSLSRFSVFYLYFELAMSERTEKLRIFSAFSKSVFGTSNFEYFYLEIRKKLFKNWFEYEWKQLKRKKMVSKNWNSLDFWSLRFYFSDLSKLFTFLA